MEEVGHKNQNEDVAATRGGGFAQAHGLYIRIDNRAQLTEKGKEKSQGIKRHDVARWKD